MGNLFVLLRARSSYQIESVDLCMCLSYRGRFNLGGGDLYLALEKSKDARVHGRPMLSTQCNGLLRAVSAVAAGPAFHNY
jgi:hypothetical protein